MSYEVCISSPPDRELLVAEIFFGHVQWAEINQEEGVLRVEFYPRPDGRPWIILYSEAVLALSEAKQRLVSG